MPFVEIHGRKIYYEIHGNGRTVVLLHHGFAGMNMWKTIYPSLLQAGYRVFMYDRRGYGRSEPGADFVDFYVGEAFCEENANDLAALDELFQLSPFHIVGQCEGGVIGVEYAGRRPQNVLSLTASSTMCFSTVTMTEFNALKFPKSFLELDPDLRHKIVSWHGEDRAEPLYEMARTRGGAYGVGFFDLRPRLTLVQCPTLVVYPDRSALFPVEQGVAFYRHLAKGELAVIPRCGHNTYDQKPDEYSRIVLNFLSRIESRQYDTEIDFNMTCLAPSPAGSQRSRSG